jgi:glutathione S-transferase
MLVLYGCGRSRWVRPLWMLRELDVPFRTVVVDRDAGDLDAPAFRALNPLGKIPVLVDGDLALAESWAMLAYLGDKFPDRGLVPPRATRARAIHDQWMFYLATELEPPIWLLHRQTTFGEGGQEVRALAETNLARAAAYVEDRLRDRPHLTGDAFGPPDIVLGHLLTWRVLAAFVEERPRLRAYRDRVTSRPGFPSFLYA